MKKFTAVILMMAMIVTGTGMGVIPVHAEEKPAEADMAEPAVNEEENTVAAEEGSAEEAETVEENPTDVPQESVTGEIQQENSTPAASASTGELTESPQGESDIQENDPNEPQVGDRANSWRYKDGELLEIETGIKRKNAVRASNATKTGIDVSEHQGTIDWEKVKAAGIDFVMIRCGYGSNFSSQDDKQWLRNVSECERLGIPYGVYLYSYARNTAMAQSEAQHVLRLLSGRKPSFPVYYDMEDSSTQSSDLASIAQTFCTTIQNSGYAVGVYSFLQWWNTRLTDSCFSNWYRWVAQWNSSCDYQGSYAIWQYTSNGSVDGIDGRVDMNYLIGAPADHGTASAVVQSHLTYSANVQDYGWMNPVADGAICGSVGINKPMKAVKISPQNIEGLTIEYQTYVKDAGWQNWVANGQASGSEEAGKYIEAVRIRLSGNAAANYDVYYRTHCANVGWLGWAVNGGDSGTVGYNYHMEALQIRLVAKGSAAPGSTQDPFHYREPGIHLQCKTHVSEIGWQSAVGNNDIAGTTGRALGIEAFTLGMSVSGVGVEYSSYVEGTGWQSAKGSGETSGTTGKAKHLEAIKIALTGENKDRYHIYYRVHVQDIGWLGWTRDGEAAGTENYGLPIEAMQIYMLSADSAQAPALGEAFRTREADVVYQAHVRDIGWQGRVSGGALAGTTGRALSVEALKLSLRGATESGSIRYRAHVQDIGWQGWKSNGTLAGTTGRALPIEAMYIELTGDAKEKYDLYYRVHSRDYGWLGWAKNGEMAGTSGCAKPMEAIEIKLVKKGEAFQGAGSGKAPNIVK